MWIDANSQVTRQVLEAAKGRLKVVGRAGVGVDNVDLVAATEVSNIYAHACPKMLRSIGHHEGSRAAFSELALLHWATSSCDDNLKHVDMDI